MSAPIIPEGATIVQTLKRSFVDVTVDAEKENAINTTEFLEASEALTTIFGRPQAPTGVIIATNSVL